MIISRAVPAFKAVRLVAKPFILNSKQNSVVKNNIRWAGHWTYRKIPIAYDSEWKKAEIVMSFTIGWILWYLFMNYEEVIGIRMPDPREWTDEELGIPPV